MNRHVILGSRSILLRTNSLSLHRNMDGPAAASPKDEWVDLADVIIEETIADKKETQKLTPTARVLDEAAGHAYVHRPGAGGHRDARRVRGGVGDDVRAVL